LPASAKPFTTSANSHVQNCAEPEPEQEPEPELEAWSFWAKFWQFWRPEQVLEPEPEPEPELGLDARSMIRRFSALGVQPELETQGPPTFH
jgi:hypothetical protein